MDATTLEYLLNPELLTQRLQDMSAATARDTLKNLLTFLQTEKAKNPPAAAAAQPPPASPDEPMVIAEHLPGSPASAALPPGAPLPRKQLLLQKMVLQLSAHLEWQLHQFDQTLSLALQQRLLECLLSATAASADAAGDQPPPPFPRDHLSPDSIAQQLQQLESSPIRHTVGAAQRPSQLFALTLFCRWILRSFSHLPLPLPMGNKCQIYSHGRLPTHTLGTEQHLGMYISSLVPVALKGLQALALHQPTAPWPPLASMPSESCFQLVDLPSGAALCTMLPPGHSLAAWTALGPDEWRARCLFDMAVYHHCFEEYALSAQSLTALQALDRITDYLHGDMHAATFNGLVRSHVLTGRASDVSLPAFHSSVLADNELMLRRMTAAADDNEASGTPPVPFYWKANFTLGSSFFQLAPATKLVEETTLSRLQGSQPPSFELFALKELPTIEHEEEEDESDYTMQDKMEMLESIKNLDVLDSYRKKVNLSCKMYDSKQKYAKLRRRSTLTALYRELRPDKIRKLVFDLGKVGASASAAAKRLSGKWTLDSAALQEFAGGLGARGPEADYTFVLLAKMQQLWRLGALSEARALWATIEGERAQKAPPPIIRNLRLQALSFELNSMLTTGAGDVADEFAQRCRNVLLDLRQDFQVAHSEVLESCIAVLVNKNKHDWDFLMQFGDHQWLPLQVTQVLLTLATQYKGASKSMVDVKKSCKHLVELLQKALQQISNKRGRGDSAVGGAAGASASGAAKLWLVSFLGKLNQPDVLQVVLSFFAALYNISIDDSNLKLHHDLLPAGGGLPFLSVPMPAYQLNNDTLLTILKLLLDRSKSNPHLQHDPAWAKLRAELHFSLSHYAPALVSFLHSLVLSTNYFNKPSVPGSADWELGITHKMVKSLSELDFHAYAVGMCQCLPETDYSVSFKNLEERGAGNDAMDGLYDSLWDVTLLEYAVSMHTKRGEQARKREALEKIGSLEVNTNNNVEILREASAAKRARFMRILCQHFL